MLSTFLELSKLESKKIRLQVLRLVLALESEALDVFRIARRLERTLWTGQGVHDVEASQPPEEATEAHRS